MYSRIIKTNIFAIKLFFSIYPAFFIMEAFNKLIGGLLFGYMIYLKINAFESITQAALYQTDFYYVLTLLLLLGLGMIVGLIISTLDGYFMNIGVKKPDLIMHEKLHLKLSEIAPVSFEDDALHDTLNRAKEGIGALRSIKSALVDILFLTLPSFIFITIFFYTINPLFIIILIVAVFPVFLAQIAKTKNVADYEETAAPLRRKNMFYENAIINKTFLKETRGLSAVPFFLEKYMSTLNNLNQSEWKFQLKSSLFEIKTNISVIISRIIILFILLYLVFINEISIAVFVVTLGAVESIFRQMHNMVAYDINTLASMSGKAHNYIACIHLPERGGEKNGQNTAEGILAANISFRYPHAKNNTINDVSVSIKMDEVVAIVGENGAGKTTLAKLLVGLYTPDKGQVTVHGMDTQNTSMDCLFADTSAVFQNFMRYKMTLGENITISKASTEEQEKLNTVCKQTNVTVNHKKFPRGYDTMLSREFGGVDLSGGEWQRIATARGIYRNHSIIVLDEPTAAIDPLEECRIYEEFCEIAKGKAALIITHRLGAAKIANRIIVMKEGKIISTGSHNELLENCDYYKTLYEAQASWYVNA